MFATPAKKKSVSLLIGGLFLLGGLVNVMTLPSPLWFNLSDLCLAYIPMALIAYRIAAGREKPGL
jgi:hypothetical protein